MTAESPISTRRGAGFTLVELLVVISIIALLVSILLPSLNRARDMAKLSVCTAHVKGLITAVHMYAGDHDGRMPCGPDVSIFPGGPPTNTVGSNIIWDGPAVAAEDRYNAHGRLLEGALSQSEAMFCPADDSGNAAEQLQRVSQEDPAAKAYSSYFYRQLDAAAEPTAMLDRLGDNQVGDPISALLMDANSLLVIPGVPIRTNHDAKKVSLGFVDGHATAVDNSAGKLTLTGGSPEMFTSVDDVFQHADTLSGK